MSLPLTTICFIACHGGPADHFATFAEHLTQKGYKIEIYGNGPAYDKFIARKLEVHRFENLEVVEKCKDASVIITDVGHPLDITLQETLAKEAPTALRIAYYDNPESFVPGGYSETAEKVMKVAQRVLFANANLAKQDNAVGLGYYPLAMAEKIAKRRTVDQTALRAKVLTDCKIEDKGQKIVVYTGGNNETYFNEAFPAFLKFLQGMDSSQYVVLLQQHPGAKAANRDGQQCKEAPIHLSQLSSEDSQVVADAMLYYQTSMSPQFVLAGIPTIQTGHNTYEDILVKNKLCAVATTEETLAAALSHLVPPANVDLHKELGISSDWPNRLEEAIISPL